MNPCAKHREELAMLALGELGSRQSETARAHMETCQGCREYFHDIRRLQTNLSAAPVDETITASTAFHRRTAGAVRAASTRREYGTTQLSLIWKTAIPALCLLAILAILRAPGRRENSAQPDTQPAAATAAFPETDSLRPTMANYLLAANQSPEALDALLATQIRLYSSAPAPDWRSLNLTD